MSLFSKKNKDNPKKGERDDEKVKKELSSVKTAKNKTIDPVKVNSEIASRILIEPWITEKASEKMAENKYIFKVINGADKRSAKRAIEELYGVTVTKANIINIPPKKRKFGAKTGWKSGYKKVMITLKDGDKIELFEGV